MGHPLSSTRPGPRHLARQAAIEVVGEGHVRTLGRANMGGEDFAYYLEKIPGCYIRFGARPPGGRGFAAHSSRFDFDESALPIGAAWMAGVARRAGAALAKGDLDARDRIETVTVEPW